MAATILTKDNFEEILSGATTPVIVDFYADWCGPCKLVAPVIEELSEEDNGVQFCKVNVDENAEIANKYGVTNIPTIIAFKNGEVYNKNVGAIPKAAILELAK